MLKIRQKSVVFWRIPRWYWIGILNLFSQNWVEYCQKESLGLSNSCHRLKTSWALVSARFPRIRSALCSVVKDKRKQGKINLVGLACLILTESAFLSIDMAMAFLLSAWSIVEMCTPSIWNVMRGSWTSHIDDCDAFVQAVYAEDVSSLEIVVVIFDLYHTGSATKRMQPLSWFLQLSASESLEVVYGLTERFSTTDVQVSWLGLDGVTVRVMWRSGIQ